MLSRALAIPALLIPVLLPRCTGTEEVPRAEPLPRATAAAIAKPAAAPAMLVVATAEPVASVAPVASALPPELVDDPSEDVPDPTPPPPKHHAHELASTAHETWVYAEPRWSARRLGYLRAGAIVARGADPVSRANCNEGWFRVEPKGYVCVGGAATLDLKDPVVVASSKRPLRDNLPYTYVMARFPTPPFYARFPTKEETLRHEPDLEGHFRSLARTEKDPSFVAPPEPDPIPDLLSTLRAIPGLGASRRNPEMLSLGRARSRSGFALLSTYEHDKRRFGLTVDMALIPIDRTRVIKPSSFHGIELNEETTLPVAFIRSHHATRYKVEPTGAITPGDALGFREAVPVTGSVRKIAGVEYLEAKDGTLLKEEQAVRVDRLRNPPAWSQGGRKWIDVSILHQSLVAYEGTKPVYVTLVSTGADGLGDPKKTHSTIQGAFLIHTKHLSVTMDDDKVGDEFDFRDVPFVQYFTEGFALHGAYWHDDFGTPRSHGCVNLAPIDAAHLFGWTDPKVPDDWHGALTLKHGTLVFVRP